MIRPLCLGSDTGNRIRGSARKRRRWAALCLVVVAAGCRSWVPVPLDDVAAREAVRVEMVDGRRVSLRDPHLLGDSILLGKVAEPPGERRIPLEDILAVEAFGTDASGTVQLTLVTLTVAGLGFFVWLFSGPST